MKKINIVNKTISPLSSGKGCPVERGGVWELPRRTPCATPSWKEGERKVPSFRGNAESPRCCRELVCGKTDGIPLFSVMTARICGMMIAIAALFATPSFADPTPEEQAALALAQKTVASKAYVDTKQDIIETGLVEFNDNPEFMLPAITTYDSTSGLVGNKIGILDQDTIEDDEGILIMYNNGAGGYGAEMDNFVPTVRAVSEALQLIMERLNKLSWNNTQSTAINAYNTEFGNGTNQWAGNSDDLIKGQFLANSLALKQNKITTGLVEFEDTETEAVCEFPSLVSYDTTSGLIGNKIGVYNYETCGPLIDDLQTFVDLGANSSAYLDNYVPTLRAVAKAFEHTWENIYEVVGWNPLTWNNTQSNAINAYNTTFGNGPNQWAGVSDFLINGQFLAKSLALKQNKLPELDTNLVLGQAGKSVLAPTTAGNVTQVALWDADGAEPDAWDVGTYFSDATANERNAIRYSIPTVGAVEVGLDQKQNKITTGLVEFTDGTMLPAITTYDSTSGLVANKIGILDYETIYDDEGGLGVYSRLNGYGSEMDNFVPTVRAVAEALQGTWDGLIWTPFTWDNSRFPAAINAYSTTFDTTTSIHVNGNWPLNQQGYLVRADTFANSLALKQNILSAKSTGNAAPRGNQAVVLNTAGNPSNVYTTAGKDLALTAKSGAEKVMNYVDGTTASATFATSQGLTEAQVKSALVSLELLKDVYDVLNTKITNNALPTGTTGTVVTYNGTNATTGVQEFTETAIASAATYDANDQLSNGNSIANVTLVETKQTKRVCGGYEPGHENDPDYCWLWDFPD